MNLPPHLLLAAAVGFAITLGAGRAQADFTGTPITFNTNGGWCWFQDPRAIIDNGQLIIASIAGFTGSGSTGGDADVTSYNFQTQTSTETLLQSAFDQDDHACPAFTVLPDGRIMVVYSTHGANNDLYWRVSTSPGETTTWSAEQTLVVNTANDGNGNTYSNPFYLSTPNEVVNFSRAIGYDPNYSVFSNISNTDNTVSSISAAYGGHWMYWQNPNNTPPLTGGNGRPYVKYASNGTNTVWFATTEDSPQNYLDSLYVGYMQFNSSGAGTVYTSTGGSLGGISTGTAPTGNGANPPSGGNQGDIASGTGLSYLPTDFTPIVKANAVYNGIDLTGKYVGWATSMQLDSSGKPYLGFVVVDNTTGAYGNDLEYYYAHLVGSAWQVSRVGYAGYPLYNGQNQYAGLMAVDPSNPNTIYVSADVNPATGGTLAGPDGKIHWQIFEGTTSNGGGSWSWTQLTDTSSDNMRPEVVAGGGNEALVWMQGSYSSYTSYNTAMVGLVQTLTGSSAWTGPGTVFDAAANWNGGLPSTNGGVAVFNGTQAGRLTLSYTGGMAGGVSDSGLSLNLTSSQTGSLTISASSANALCFDGINLAAGAGGLTLGNGGSSQFTISLGNSLITHYWTNNSSNAATINSDVVFQTGGGVNETLALGGTGNWLFNNSLTSLNSVLSLTDNGTGLATLAGSSALGTVAITGGGTLAASGPISASALAFSAPGGWLSLGGNMSAAGLSFDNNATSAITGAIAGSALTVSGGFFQLGSSALSGANSAGVQTLSMSGLSSFVFSSSGQPFQVGGNVVGTSSSPGDAGVLIMARSNTVIAASFGVASASGSSYNGPDNNYGTVYLGQTNTIWANVVSVDGAIKGLGLLQFAGNLGANPTLTIRDSGGGNAATLLVGFNSSNYDPSGGTIDLVAGVNGQSILDAAFSSGTLGEATGTGSAASTAAAVLRIGAGTLDVSGLLLISEVRGVGNVAGSVTVDGGRLSAGTLTLGDQRSTGVPTAIFTLDGGGTLDATLVQSGSGTAATRTFDWNDGTIANYNGTGGTTGLTVSIPALTMAATGTHAVWVDPGYAGTISAAIGGPGSLVKEGGGQLVLSGTNTYSGTTTVAGGTLVLADSEAVVDGANLIVGTDLSAFGSVVPAQASGAATAPEVAPVPEPGTLVLLAAAGTLLFLHRSRR